MFNNNLQKQKTNAEHRDTSMKIVLKILFGVACWGHSDDFQTKSTAFRQLDDISAALGIVPQTDDRATDSVSSSLQDNMYFSICLGLFLSHSEKPT